MRVHRTTVHTFTYHDHRHQATTRQAPPHTMSTGTRLPDLILPIEIVQLIGSYMACNAGCAHTMIISIDSINYDHERTRYTLIIYD